MTEARFMEGLVQEEGLIFERSREGKRAFSLPEPDVPVRGLSEIVPGDLLREEIEDFPEVSEVDVVRHFTRLSTWNYGVDTGYYPLGSCTMKYNPKVNEDMSRLPGFAHSHPYQGDELSQGALRVMFELAEFLAEIGGMAKVSLAPAAGAHGELTAHWNSHHSGIPRKKRQPEVKDHRAGFGARHEPRVNFQVWLRADRDQIERARLRRRARGRRPYDR